MEWFTTEGMTVRSRLDQPFGTLQATFNLYSVQLPWLRLWPEDQQDSPAPLPPVTPESLLNYFGLLFAEEGESLLNYYTEAGGIIQLGDFVDNCDLDFFGVPEPRIQIEEDGNPVDAAICLMEKLEESTRYAQIRKVIVQHEDIEAYLASIAQLRLGVKELGIQTAHVYLAGISIVNEGADWALTISELAEGNLYAAAGLLPFIPAGAGFIVRNSAGEELIQFSANTVNKMRAALKLQGINSVRSRYNRVRALRALRDHGHIPQAQFGEVMKGLYDTGYLKIQNRSSRAALNRMLGAPPSTIRDPQAHHWLPLEFEDFFIERGIDPNAYGDWVPGVVHADWHNVARNGMRYNEYWAQFVADNPFAAEEDIFNFLESTIIPIYAPEP